QDGTMGVNGPSSPKERPMSVATDRNLLYGILALQMDFVSRDQLVEAMNAWVLEKQTALGEILQRRGALDEDTARLLDRLVQKHIEHHGNDPRRSLAALHAETPLKQELTRIEDDEVRDSVLSLRRPDEGPPRTFLRPVRPAADGTERYRFLREHARGGLGQVSVALDLELNREVALKEI